MDFSEIISKRRNGLTNNDLAAAVTAEGYSVTGETIRLWRKGDTSPTRRPAASAVARALGVNEGIVFLSLGWTPPGADEELTDFELAQELDRIAKRIDGLQAIAERVEGLQTELSRLVAALRASGAIDAELTIEGSVPLETRIQPGTGELLESALGAVESDDGRGDGPKRVERGA